MADDPKVSWGQAEFNALRTEILALSDAARKTIRFYLPLAAAPYAVPYVLKRLDDTLLWSICTGVSGLLLLGMTQSLFWSADGVRRIGMYIKEVIEPKTGGALMWERIYFALDLRTARWLGEEFVMALVPTLANIVAALGAGVVFLPDERWFVPPLTAIVPASISVWYFRHLVRAARGREEYATVIAEMTAPAIPECRDWTPVRAENEIIPPQPTVSATPPYPFE